MLLAFSEGGPGLTLGLSFIFRGEDIKKKGMTELNFYKRKKDYEFNSRDCFTRKCDVRLTPEQDNKLNELASQNGVSRGEVVRKAIEDFYRFNSREED